MGRAAWGTGPGAAVAEVPSVEGATHEDILPRRAAHEPAARTYARALPVVPVRARGVVDRDADPVSAGWGAAALSPAPVLAAAVPRECLRRGLIVGLGGRHRRVVQLLPPLTITIHKPRVRKPRTRKPGNPPTRLPTPRRGAPS